MSGPARTRTPDPTLVREALAAAGIGVWDWNVVSGDLAWDDEIARIHGLEPTAFDGTLATFLSHVHEADQPTVTGAIQDALARGGDFHTEFRVVGRDGSTTWVQERGKVILDEKGTARRVVGIGSDTTALHFAREQAGSTLDHITGGLMTIDADWRVTFANAYAAAMVQRSIDDLIGEQFWRMFPETVGTQLWHRYHAAMRTQEAQVFEAYYGEAQGWFEVRATPSPAVLTLSFQNIDERHAAAAAQDALVARLESALARQNQTQSVVMALAESLTVDDVAAAVLALADSVLDTRFAGVALVNDDGTSLQIVTLDRLPAWAPTRLDVPSALGDAVRLRQPMYHSSRADLLVTYPDVAGNPDLELDEAFANVPLRVADRVLGALSLSWARPRVFSEPDRTFIRMLAAQCAQAIERVQLFARQRDVADILQQAMLPTELPLLDGVTVAACYLPATTDLTVGGDWYDAFVLDDGRLAFAVGDVSGHGVQAAAVMGQIRNALRAYVVEGHGPALSLAKLDELVARDAHGLFATVIVGVYDAASRDVVWASAGHPPLLLRTAGTARFLEGHVGAPVGVQGPQGHHDQRLTLEVGQQVVAYTDGLVERRHEDLGLGLARLARAVVGAGSGIAEAGWCVALVEAVLGSSSREDDICVLALECT